MSVTPQGGINTQIITAGQPVNVIPAGVNGGYIVNPYLATDQGQSAGSTAADLIVDPVSPAGIVGNNTAIRLSPGQTFSVIPLSATIVMANSQLNGHKFTAVWW
jgi:hypothetical protein